jgi:hypothetical protein
MKRWPRLIVVLAAMLLLVLVGKAFAPPGGKKGQPPAQPFGPPKLPQPKVLPPQFQQPNPPVFQQPLPPGQPVLQQWQQGVDPLQEIKSHLINEPHRALDELRSMGAGLPEPEQQSLARQATKNLVEAAKKDKAHVWLPRVIIASANPRRLDPTMEFVLQCLQEDLEERRLLESLEQLLGWMANPEEAGPGAQHLLQHLKMPESLRGPLKTTAAQCQEYQALGMLKKAIDTWKDGGDPADITALRKLPVDSIPEGIRKPASGLKGVSAFMDLQDIKEGWKPWTEPPDVVVLKQAVAAFKVGSGDEELAQRVLLDLALKACLDGFPAEGKALLAEAKGSPEYAARLLADLRTLVVGEGKVTTWPALLAREEFARKQAGTKEAKGPPAPGVALLIRTELAKSWWSLPDLKEDKGKKANSLDLVVSLASGYRKALEPLIEPALNHTLGQLENSEELLKARLKTLKQGREALTRMAEQVEQVRKAPGMQRPLNSIERLLVYHYQRENLRKNQQKTAADIKKTLDKAGLPR